MRLRHRLAGNLKPVVTALRRKHPKANSDPTPWGCPFPFWMARGRKSQTMVDGVSDEY
jgi:hypothetical protein